MSTKTGNEPELSGARKRKELQDFEAELDRLMAINRHNPPNIVVRGKSTILAALVDPLVKRLSDLMDQQDTDKASGDEPMIGGQR
jgi:hypothetical protein